MIEFIDDVARKRGRWEELAVEACKTRAAAALASESGRFVVPEVVAERPDDGVLETRRVHGFVSLIQLAERGIPGLSRHLERAGVALALIHARLSLPAHLRLPLPEPFAGAPADGCFLHGDFNGSNVGVDTHADDLVILDWASAPGLGAVGTYGSRYFDLIWFVLFFFRSRPARLGLRWQPERWADDFLGAYVDAGGRCDPVTFRRYLDACRPFLAEDLRREYSRNAHGVRGVLYRLWRRAGWARWERYAASLDLREVGT